MNIEILKTTFLFLTLLFYCQMLTAFDDCALAMGQMELIAITESNTSASHSITEFKVASIEENAFNLVWKFNENIDKRIISHQVILQKSTTGFDFEDIVLDNSSEGYRDWNVQKNLQYFYRLKIIDKTSTTHHSDILTVSLQVNSAVLTVSSFTNPMDKYLELQIHSLLSGKVNCVILDINGLLVTSFVHTIDLGINDFQIDIKSLQPNQYYLQIEINNEVLFRPFTKF